MKITILQRNIEWANPQANVERADEAINRLPDADLFVLPEMFSTGFCTKPEGVAESADSETLHWMQRKAVERNCAVAGSVAVQENGKYYNRFYFVHPDGSVQHYDKKHLFTYGGEDKRFTAGTQRVVVNYRGVRILLEVCYDLRFPVWSRNLGDYDMILYVASWPTPRVDAWSALLRARAIENQCYVAELIGWAISLYSPSFALRLGMAMKSPFSPSITLISCTTNSSSIVIDTTAFIFPSFVTLRTLTSVMFINFYAPFTP